MISACGSLPIPWSVGDLLIDFRANTPTYSMYTVLPSMEFWPSDLFALRGLARGRKGSIRFVSTVRSC